MSEYDARDVLEKYVGVLNTTSDAIIRDADALLHPKETIKAVLQHCIKTIEAVDMRQFLRGAYLSLASFQVLSDQERKAVVLLKEVGPPAPSGDELHEEQINRLSDVATPLQTVMTRLQSETAILSQELRLLPGADAPAADT